MLIPAGTRSRCEICSKLAIKIPERCHWPRSVSLLLTLNYFTPCSSVSIVNFEHIITSWDAYLDHKTEFSEYLKTIFTKHERKSSNIIVLTRNCRKDILSGKYII